MIETIIKHLDNKQLVSMTISNNYKYVINGYQKTVFDTIIITGWSDNIGDSIIDKEVKSYIGEIFPKKPLDVCNTMHFPCHFIDTEERSYNIKDVQIYDCFICLNTPCICDGNFNPEFI